MHQAVELLIKRMESNPEEFSGDAHDRWMRHIKRYEEFMTDEERDAILEKHRAIMMTRMHKDIMSELLYGDEQRQEDRRAMLEAASNSLTSSLVFSPSQGVEAMRISPEGVIGIGRATISNNISIDGETLDKPTLRKLKALLKQ
jgi:hypothetical protein